MAPGALNPLAQKQLGHVLELLIAGRHGAVPGHRRIMGHVAGGRHHFAHELVVGLVLPQALANPVVKGESAPCLSVIPPLVAQQRAPLRGEIIGVVTRGQQLVDPPVALVGRCVGQKRLGFGERWQPAGDVERRAADKRGVVAHGRGSDAQQRQLGKHDLVDEVARLGGSRRRAPSGTRPRKTSTCPL